MASVHRPFAAPPRLAALIASQGGAFTAAQANAAGVGAEEVQWLRRHGELRGLRRGVYALASEHDAKTVSGRYRTETHAALLVLRRPTTVSHTSAAEWCDLPLLRPDLDVLHVTRPELRASRLEAGIHHHPGALPPGHVHRVRGFPVTTPARTAVDIARTAPFADGLAACDSALRCGAAPDRLTEALTFCRAWSGARSASRVVAEADGRAANPGESFSRAVIMGLGLAPTDLQVEVRDRQGLIGYADMGWLPLKVLGEFDGRGKYGASAGEASEVVWREKRREDRLRAQGFLVVRWTWSELLRPAELGSRIRDQLARAERLGLRTA